MLILSVPGLEELMVFNGLTMFGATIQSLMRGLSLIVLATFPPREKAMLPQLSMM